MQVFKDTTTRPVCTPASAQSYNAQTTVRKLDLQLNSEIERGIYAAKEKFDNTVKGLDIAELQVHTYGKDYIKSKKLSPDAVMQLAFQVRTEDFHFRGIARHKQQMKLLKVSLQARGPY